MSWMISCVMNVRGPVVGENLLHFSVLMLPVCSITVREFHKPLVKEGGDRPRHISFRWN